MTRERINTPLAPTAIGPYEQAVGAANLIFTSGQIAIDPQNNKFISGGIQEQTKQVLKNIQSILQAGGSSLENVLKTTVYLKNMSDFQEMNSIYSEFFKDSKPARSCVEVSSLPKDALIEIDAIAVIQT